MFLDLTSRPFTPKDTKPNSEFIVFKYTNPEQSEMEKLEAYNE